MKALARVEQLIFPLTIVLCCLRGLVSSAVLICIRSVQKTSHGGVERLPLLKVGLGGSLGDVWWIPWPRVAVALPVDLLSATLLCVWGGKCSG